MRYFFKLIRNVVFIKFFIKKSFSSIIAQLVVFAILIFPFIYLARKMKTFKMTDIMVIFFILILLFFSFLEQIYAK